MRWSEVRRRFDIKRRFDARGVRGCRRQVLQDLSLVDQLKITESRKSFVRAKVRGASVRKHLALDYYKHVHGDWAVIWVLTCLAGYRILQERGIDPSEKGNPESLNAFLNLGAIVAYMYFARPGIRVLVNSKALTKRAVIAFGMSLFTLISIAAAQDSLTYIEHSAPLNSREERFTLAAWAILSLWPIAAMRRKIVATKRSQEMCHSYDALALAVLKFISELQAKKLHWLRDGTAKRWVASLEELAEIASYTLSCPNRNVTGDREAEVALRVESRRIAAVFRSHKIDIARAADSADIEAIIDSLTFGLEAILRRDRDALLSQAPDVPNDPYMTIGRRITPGATLISLGIFIPLIPAISEISQAASYLRWTLVVAGIVMLTSSNAEVAARVNESMGKSMAMKA
ncbi:hypothetical protein ACJWDR_19005 [Streptomyces tauricus]|uniref:hypothetical protein n=1 Tax=Streptomyces tauricus TaxID=68274 RepID=UPI00387EF333